MIHFCDAICLTAYTLNMVETSFSSSSLPLHVYVKMDGVGSHIHIYGYNPHILALRGGGEIDLLMGGYLAEKSLLAPSISYYMQVSKWF